MPKKKKEKYWDYGMPKGELGPFVWHVWIKGKKKPERMVAFDHQHIEDQLEGKDMIKAVKQPEENYEPEGMPLGPIGSVVNRPADYDTGFKILRAWVDENGGPPESIRKRLRELYIDYDKGK